MDDLLGSGSSILNGLRDQRSTLKVCAHDLIQDLERKKKIPICARADNLHVFVFYHFPEKSEKGVYIPMIDTNEKIMFPDPVSGVHIYHNSLIVSVFMLF